MSLNMDSPHMQWTDRATQSLGQEYSNVSLGGAMSGPIRWDRAFYNVAYQLGRRANDLQTLLTTDAVGLESAGISGDSATRLLGILNGAGVPVGVGIWPGVDNGIGATVGTGSGVIDPAFATMVWSLVVPPGAGIR